jgi:hypothetical protein
VTRTAARALLAALATAAAARAAEVAAVDVQAYEVYTELTAYLDKAAAFTCEPGAEARTLVLTVAAEPRRELAAAPAGRIGAVRVARARGATTFIITTAEDVGSFRAYSQIDPPAVVVDVYRRLELTPPRRARAYEKLLAGKKLLLVDDDDGPSNGNQYSVDVDERYRAALKKLGVPFEERVVRSGRDGPSADELAPYPFVIWFTGLDARPVVISPADERAMAAYLEGGGRLVLVSQNYLSDSSSKGASAFCRNVLGVAKFEADTQVSAVTCAPALAAPRPEYDLDNELTVIGNWGDGFVAAADAEVLLTAGALAYGMARPAGAGRVAFFSVALENAGYTQRVAEVTAATLDRLAVQ